MQSLKSVKIVFYQKIPIRIQKWIELPNNRATTLSRNKLKNSIFLIEYSTYWFHCELSYIFLC